MRDRDCLFESCALWASLRDKTSSHKSQNQLSFRRWVSTWGDASGWLCRTWSASGLAGSRRGFSSTDHCTWGCGLRKGPFLSCWWSQTLISCWCECLLDCRPCWFEGSSRQFQHWVSSRWFEPDPIVSLSHLGPTSLLCSATAHRSLSMKHWLSIVHGNILVLATP